MHSRFFFSPDMTDSRIARVCTGFPRRSRINSERAISLGRSADRMMPLFDMENRVREFGGASALYGIVERNYQHFFHPRPALVTVILKSRWPEIK